MAGTVHGIHFSFRLGAGQARDFDALARAAGLRRSELLRLVVGNVARGDLPAGLLDAGFDLSRARQVSE